MAVLVMLSAGLAACTIGPHGRSDTAGGPDSAASSPETVAALDRAALAALVIGPQRSPEHIARNAARHPLATLEFFGLERDMTVLEALPGGLWYGEIIAPYVREKGQYIAASYDVTLPDRPDYQLRLHEAMVERFESEPETFGGARIAKLSAPESVDLGPPRSVDMVLTFRNMHGWVRDGVEDEVLAAFYEVLKPGGVLGIVQHRAGPRSDPEKFIGYLPEERVIAMAEAAGFELEARSEINANPRDTADYPGGVWTLPPSLRLGDEDRERYEAIGESDRMTLRFRKPRADDGA
jgi:predicted methyltransferase